MNKLKKLVTIMLIGAMLFSRGSYFVYATEAVPAGEAQPAGEAEKAEKADKQDKGEAVPAGEAQPAGEAVVPTDPTPTPEETLITEALVTEQTAEVDHGGTNSNGNIGNTTIETGDAINDSGIYNLANTNLSGSGDGSGTGDGGASISNTNNGSDSTNTGEINNTSNNTLDQDNSAVVVNNANQSAVTGDNSASENLGNSTIVTGDANVTATIITAANTNVDGVAVSEFNIVDDHFGDYLLDFNAGCISGCGGGPILVENTDNGPGSANDGTVNNTTNNNTGQSNDGTVTNNVDLLADSGNNETSRNNSGDSIIDTGDASVAANLLTFLNNNIAGNVMFGAVNIFGNLIGDIILPDNVFDSFACSTCGGGTNVTNTGNGADSDNNALVNDTTNNNVFQSNDATITNNLYMDAETGDNSASKNNQGDVAVTTGNTSLDASILNIANMNLFGADMWLVIVNEAGNWIGKILGAPDGSSLAGSDGVEFAIDPNGMINVINANNGDGSISNGTVNNTTNNDLNQTNVANVTNNVNLFANTGGNTADRNNNGDVSITTGDAEAIANIVNFVNNNIAGGRILITFVNVFGSWTGDFITPGHPKVTTANTQGDGSNNSVSNNSQTSSGNASGNLSVTNSGNTNLVAGAGFFGASANNAVSNATPNTEIEVAGINNLNTLSGLTRAIDTENKSANINLAWAIFALPLAGLALITRKRYLRKNI